MLDSSVTYPHFVFTLIAGSKIVVSYQGNQPPQDHEIQNYGELLRSLADQADLRCLWYTDGPRPSREQQERLSSTVPKHQWRVALISSSAGMRFIAAASSLANRNVRFFEPQELPQALRHLQCTFEEQRAVQMILAELKYSVDAAETPSAFARNA
ncbi:MAG TPA: hypothetical protein VFG30_11165 [Polyangiales bacterium]|nr:hypothetical protein [Polyangiales bacterium]